MKGKPKRSTEHQPIPFPEMVKRLLDMPPASTAKGQKSKKGAQIKGRKKLLHTE